VDLDEVLAATFSLVSPHLTERRRDTDPGLLQALDGLIDPDTRGDPESPLRWTCRSTRELAEALTAQGHPVSDDTVGRLLKQQGHRLQRTVNTLEGARHPDRDAQFRYLAVAGPRRAGPRPLPAGAQGV
jgi:Rhodopirellula transposase DDE domain